jgi:5-methylcytosine-specific restriction protein A
MKPRTLCSCGCGKILDAGTLCQYRQKQQRARKARFDQRRPTARERGYDHRWRKARDQYLQAHPHCQRCGKPATLVDHIIPHRGDKALFWFPGNWQPLCTPCHNSAKQREERNLP